MNKIIVPAVIAKTQQELDDILTKIGTRASLLQLDVMDGKFVPNHSLDFDFEVPVEKYTFEAHLMIEDPGEWIDRHHKKVETIIVHIEAASNPRKFIESIKSRQKKAAFALNPETEIDSIRDCLPELDQVLVMTVHPGFYGSPFLPEMMEKIRTLRDSRPDLDIEVDGGIKPDTIEMVDEAGANMFVSGSYLIRSDDIQERINTLRDKLKA
jgi:ribulose-phosphate 3-epimerase